MVGSNTEGYKLPDRFHIPVRGPVLANMACHNIGHTNGSLEPAAAALNTEYELVALFRHKGDYKQLGHFTAVVWHEENQECYSFDDRKVEPLLEKDGIFHKDTNSLETEAYLILYKRVDLSRADMNK